MNLISICKNIVTFGTSTASKKQTGETLRAHPRFADVSVEIMCEDRSGSPVLVAQRSADV